MSSLGRQQFKMHIILEKDPNTELMSHRSASYVHETKGSSSENAATGWQRGAVRRLYQSRVSRCFGSLVANEVHWIHTMFTLHGATSGNRRLITESNFRLFVNVYHTLRFHLSEEWPRVRNRKAKDNDDHTASDYQRDPHGKGYSQHSTPLQPLIINQRPILPIIQLINTIRTPNQNQHNRQTQTPTNT